MGRGSVSCIALLLGVGLAWPAWGDVSDPFKTAQQRQLAHALADARVLSSLCGVTVMDQEFAAAKLAGMVRQGITVRQIGLFIERESVDLLAQNQALGQGRACDIGMERYGRHGTDIPGLLN